MLIEKCHAVFRLLTRLGTRVKENELKSRLCCDRLPSVMSAQAMPQPYLNGILAMYRSDENGNIAAYSDTAFFKRKYEPRFGRCTINVFKKIHLQVSSPYQHATSRHRSVWQHRGCVSQAEGSILNRYDAVSGIWERESQHSATSSLL